MKSKRPVNLDLTTYRFPRMAIVSILHRVSGVVLFLALPLLLWALHQSLESQQSFEALQQCLQSPLAIIVVWVILMAALFHLLAGVRHLLMDMGHFEGLTASKVTATVLLGLTLVLIILTGVWLW